MGGGSGLVSAVCQREGVKMAKKASAGLWMFPWGNISQKDSNHIYEDMIIHMTERLGSNIRIFISTQID